MVRVFLRARWAAMSVVGSGGRGRRRDL